MKICQRCGVDKKGNIGGNCSAWGSYYERHLWGKDLTTKLTITSEKATTNKTTWVERFEEIGFGNQAIIVGTKRVELKSFIQAELQQQRREWIEMIEGMKGIAEHHAWEQMRRQSWGYDQALDDIIKKVEDK